MINCVITLSKWLWKARANGKSLEFHCQISLVKWGKNITAVAIVKVSLPQRYYHYHRHHHHRSHILLKTALNNQSNSRVFFSQRAKAVLALVVTNKQHSNEFSLAQSCVVAMWNLTLEGLLGVVWKTEKLASRTLIHNCHLFKVQAIRSFHKR